MNRIPFQKHDRSKFKDIAKSLFRGLGSIDPKKPFRDRDLEAKTQNPDSLRELFAKCLDYDDTHDLTTCAGKYPFPPPGTITRADIQLSVALGFSKLTKVSLLEAWERAGRAGLHRLSIDESSVEHQRGKQLEARLGQVTDAPEPPASTNVRWHTEQQRFFNNGAPSFELAVQPSGHAFHWPSFINLYNAIRDSKLHRSIVDPNEQFPVGSDEALDSFLSKQLIPQSWIPLEVYVKSGLEILDHEVIWIFVESGECIGRAIRHKTHGGVLPRLYLTDAEVAEGISDVITGRYIQRGSSRDIPYIANPKGNTPVFTLKPGASQPVGAINDPLKQPQVQTSDLMLIPRLLASGLGYQKVVGAPSVQWALDGEPVRKNADNPSSLETTYYDTTRWLSENDMPELFPDYRADPNAGRKDFFADFREAPNRVFLPPKSIDFQKRAFSILDRKKKAAESLLQNAGKSGEFLAACKAELSSVEMEKLGGVLLEASGNSALIQNADNVAALIAQRFPELSYYGPLAISGAIFTHSLGEAFDDIYLDTLQLSDILAGLVMLHAGYQTPAPFPFFPRLPFTVAVSEWLSGVTDLNDIHQVATRLKGFVEALQTQKERINNIQAALERDKSLRRKALDHGYAYVGQVMPRAKPRSVTQMLGALDH
ncbi:hypothetical protein [Pseudomonas orientalis]|uniref:Uncharacterized protein n=1 Tax=Pseudomonas orientalis TaxID=76758 RepID=A0A2L0RZ77_9PSED|nr:hypothetical protein [Pseudomonas orientalis]AUZ47318.1 hypothetical protein BOP93_17550 [Pseudomonas orientalis]